MINLRDCHSRISYKEKETIVTYPIYFPIYFYGRTHFMFDHERTTINLVPTGFVRRENKALHKRTNVNKESCASSQDSPLNSQFHSMKERMEHISTCTTKRMEKSLIFSQCEHAGESKQRQVCTVSLRVILGRAVAESEMMGNDSRARIESRGNPEIVLLFPLITIGFPQLASLSLPGYEFYSLCGARARRILQRGCSGLRQVKRLLEQGRRSEPTRTNQRFLSERTRERERKMQVSLSSLWRSRRTKEGIEGGFLFYPDTFLPFTLATLRRGEAMPKIDLSHRIVPAENGYKLNEGKGSEGRKRVCRLRGRKLCNSECSRVVRRGEDETQPSFAIFSLSLSLNAYLHAELNLDQTRQRSGPEKSVESDIILRASRKFSLHRGKRQVQEGNII